MNHNRHKKNINKVVRYLTILQSDLLFSGKYYILEADNVHQNAIKGS